MRFKVRIQRTWHRFKQWWHFRFGPRLIVRFNKPCPHCGGEVIHKHETRVEHNDIVARMGFRCTKCSSWINADE